MTMNPFTMNPQTRSRLMLHSHHKAHRLAADVVRMADVLSLIAALAERRTSALGDPLPTEAARLQEIGRLARSALVGATPPELSGAR